jgi:hypothetical protein
MKAPTHGRSWAVPISAFVVLFMLAAGLPLVGLPPALPGSNDLKTAQAAKAAPVLPPTWTSAAAQLQRDRPDLSPLDAAEILTAIFPSLANASYSVGAWTAAAEAMSAALNGSYNTAVQPFDAFAATAVGVGGGEVGGLLIAACAAGLVSFGLGCVVGIAIVALAAVVSYILGQDAVNALANAAARNQELALMKAAERQFNQQADADSTALSALNLTVYALGYEAAASALTQLGNASFNGALDAVQSGIASQLSAYSVFAMYELGQVQSDLMTDSNVAEGSTNTLGTFCPTVNSASPLGSAGTTTLVFPNGAAATCPQSSPSTFTFDNGTIYPTTEFVAGSLSAGVCSNPESVYFTPSDSIYVTDVTDSSWALTLIPVGQDGHGWLNYSGSGHFGGVTAPAGSGYGYGYVLCSTDAHATDVYIAGGFPIDNAADNAAKAAGPNFIMLDKRTSTISILSDTYILPNAAGSAQYSVNVLGGINGSGTRAVENHLFDYPYAILNLAEAEAQAYWTFLRLLGYTSASSVPYNCLILTPNIALPPSATQAALSNGVNGTALLTLYYLTLIEIGKSYNVNATLNSTTFCGKHINPSVLLGSNFTLPFGTYGMGYVYVPHATHTSSGTSTQLWSNPNSWNLSGLVFISPIAESLTVSLNHSWLLPENNVVQILVEPLLTTNGTTSPALVNRYGPEGCFNKNATSCYTSGYDLNISSFVVGNSTVPYNGSAFPTGADPHVTNGSRPAVYLTTCFVATGSSAYNNPTYHVTKTTTCQFNVTSFVSVVTNWGCGLNVSAIASGDCGIGGGVLISLGACGLNLPLIGPFVGSIANTLSAIPFIGPYACGIAEFVVVFLLALVVIVVAYVVFRTIPDAFKEQ